MNKNEIINSIAQNSGLTKADSARALDAFIQTVSESLQQRKEIRLVGFGTFTTADRRATEGRNPRTGESIQIPATTLPKFRAGKVLKETVARG